MEKVGRSGTNGLNATWAVSLFALLLMMITLCLRPDFNFMQEYAKAKLVGGGGQSQPQQDVGDNATESTSQPIDKLLGGLLASEFDENSCLSRYQSVLFRKISPHNPSPYLISKLRDYEKLHKRCAPYTDSYNRTLEQLSSNHTTTPTDCHYIIWVAYNGLGNKIVSISSAFLYALLTNRVLLIQQENDLSNLFCEPFPDTSWLLPLDFPIEFAKLNTRHPHFYVKALKIYYNNDTGPKMWPPSYVYVYLGHEYNDEKQLFYCEEDQTPLLDVPWLILLTDNYFVPSLFWIPTFEKELTKMFPNKETVFHHLVRYLFHPSNQVWGLVTRFYEAYLAKTNEKIGLQIRVFDKNTAPFELVLDQILGCFRNEKLLPEIDTNDSVPNSVEVPISNPVTKSVLITSLYSGYYDKIRTMYWTRPTVTGEVVEVFQPSHEEFQQFGDNMHNMKAWAEMNLLSLCDVLVTSGRSTFGYIAQGLGGTKPWILYKPENRTAPDPPCGRAVSMEPCFHSPPTSRCRAKMDTGDNTTVVPYVMHCEDRVLGIKLFNNA